MNEPGLYADLKDLILPESERAALLKSLTHGEEWLKYFIDDVGIWVVRDLIEDLSLQRRVCEEKLESSESKYALARLAIDLLKDDCKFNEDIRGGLNDMDSGDVGDYE